MRFYLKIICLFIILTALYGCGDDGGGAGGTSVADNYVFPAGQSMLTFSAMSTSRLPAPINGIDFSVTLPRGMSVTTTGGNAEIYPGTVFPGSALKGAGLVFGVYSASTRKAYLGMSTGSGAYRSGQFLRLVCTVDPGYSITLGDLKAANTPVPINKAVGYDSTTGDSILITDKVRVSIGAVR